MGSRGNSRTKGRRGATDQDSSYDEISRQLQQLTDSKVASNAKLAANQKQKSNSSRPDILGASDPSQVQDGQKSASLKSRSRHDRTSTLNGTRQKQDTQSSINLDNQLVTSEAEDLGELREAIIELYLAIKIRSTDEVSCYS